MHLDYLISDLALILIVAAIVTLFFKKINQPVVLGYIVAGFLISPNFEYLPTVVEAGDIHVWANIGVVFLMFGLGLEFSFKKIATVGGSAFVIALTVMSAMLLIGTGVGSLLGWGKMDCIFLGGMLSMSSTMIILKAYEEYNLKKEKFAQIVLGTLVIEDIAGIFNICGCGYPDETLDFMRRVLNCFHSERIHNIPDQPYRNGYFEHELFKKEFGIDFCRKPDEQPHYHVYLWVLYNLDELGVTEHGTNIFCSHLAPWKGHYICDILNAWYEYYKEDDNEGRLK